MDGVRFGNSESTACSAVSVLVGSRKFRPWTMGVSLCDEES